MANNKSKINENVGGEISDKTDASETTERMANSVEIKRRQRDKAGNARIQIN